jgi:hypothetical protein
MAEIAVDPAALATVAANANNAASAMAAANMATTLASLASAMPGSLTAGIAGQAGSNCEASRSDVQKRCANFGAAVQNGGENYTATDTGVAGSFGS